MSKLNEKAIQPYSPSWFNRFSAWIGRLPGPLWLWYVMVSLLIFVSGLVVQRLGGSGSLQDWDPINFIAIAQIGFIFLIIQYLDNYAVRAFDEFQPAFKEADRDKIPDLKWRLTMMPSKLTIYFCLGFMLFGLSLVVSAFLLGQNFGSTIEIAPGLFGAFTGFVMLLLWFINGLLAAHTVHQLRLVNEIFTNYAVVHPFHQKELFAFSGLSARTGVGLVIITPLWIIFDPGQVSLVICIVFAIFGFVAFIVPLVGVHTMLEKEKDRLLDQNGKLIEKAVLRLVSGLESNPETDLSSADQSISSLERVRQQIERISTWPWKGETFRRFSTAIILPTLIWIIQFLLSKYLFSG